MPKTYFTIQYLDSQNKNCYILKDKNKVVFEFFTKESVETCCQIIEMITNNSCNIISKKKSSKRSTRFIRKNKLISEDIEKCIKILNTPKQGKLQAIKYLQTCIKISKELASRFIDAFVGKKELKLKTTLNFDELLKCIQFNKKYGKDNAIRYIQQNTDLNERTATTYFDYLELIDFYVEHETPDVKIHNRQYFDLDDLYWDDDINKFEYYYDEE